MAKPQASKKPAASAPAAATVADVVTTQVVGVEFELEPSEILAHREYDDRVVVVTIDGRKLERAK